MERTFVQYVSSHLLYYATLASTVSIQQYHQHRFLCNSVNGQVPLDVYVSVFGQALIGLIITSTWPSKFSELAVPIFSSKGAQKVILLLPLSVTHWFSFCALINPGSSGGDYVVHIAGQFDRIFLCPQPLAFQRLRGYSSTPRMTCRRRRRCWCWCWWRPQRHFSQPSTGCRIRMHWLVIRLTRSTIHQGRIVGKACRIKQKTEILLVFQHYGVSDDDFVRQVTIEMARCESFQDRAV